METNVEHHFTDRHYKANALCGSISYPVSIIVRSAPNMPTPRVDIVWLKSKPKNLEEIETQLTHQVLDYEKTLN